MTAEHLGRDMVDIDAIIELSYAINPHSKESPSIHLQKRGGRWIASARVGFFSRDADSDSPSGAMLTLHDDLVIINCNVRDKTSSLINRFARNVAKTLRLITEKDKT